MSFTRYAKDAILTKAFTEGSLFDVENFYIGLWCSPIVDSLGNFSEIGEVTAESYSRAVIPNVSGQFSEVFGQDVRNLNEIVFNDATEDWGVVTHVGFFDADIPVEDSDECNLLFYCELGTSREVVLGDIVKFPPASIRIGIE